MRLKNRLAAEPINTGLENFSDLSLLETFFKRLAADGVGLVTVFAPAVSSQARQDDSVIDGTCDDFRRWRPILETVHKFDCRAAVQLNHIGQDAASFYPISSVGGVSNRTGRTYHAAAGFQIRRVVRQFTNCALRAASVGFDAVEINASGRSFIASFLSPAVNTRRDVWGANQLGRFRLLLEVVRGCKKAVGPDKAVGVRFNLIDFSPKGAPWSEILRLIQMLRIAGADYFIGTAGGFDERVPTYMHDIPEGVWVPDFKDLALASDLPVFFPDPGSDFAELENIAREHPNAVFSFSSAILGDSAFIRKNIGLVPGKVRPWVEHHNCGVPTDVLRTRRLFDLTDPCRFGHFPEAHLQACRPKRVAVVGGGVAGMLFAYVAASRGHRVTLFEKSDTLGGRLHLLEKREQASKYKDWMNLMKNNLTLAKVEVICGKRANLPELRSTRGFDHFVIASGSEPEIPDIPGITASNVLTYDELLNGEPVGNRVAVIGNGRIALNISRFLLDNKAENQFSVQDWRSAWGVDSVKEHTGGVLGVVPEIDRTQRQLYLLELAPEVTRKLFSKDYNRWELTWLRMRGARTVKDIHIEMIDEHAVRISDRPDRSNRETLRVDHVVICSESIPNLLDRVGCTAGEDRVTVVGAASSPRGYLNFVDIVTQVYEKASRL